MGCSPRQVGSPPGRYETPVFGGSQHAVVIKVAKLQPVDVDQSNRGEEVGK